VRALTIAAISRARVTKEASTGTPVGSLILDEIRICIAAASGGQGEMAWLTDLLFRSRVGRLCQTILDGTERASFTNAEFEVVGSPANLTPRVEDGNRPYATVLRWGRRRPATMEDVHELFAPAEQELSECRRAALRLSRAAGKAFRTGKVDHALISEAEIALARARATAAEAASLLYRIAFEHEYADRQWLSFVEKFHDAEAEIADALMAMRFVLDDPLDPY
jgi:hypothetical protein